MAIIALKGRETTMVVDGVSQQVIPFVGTDRPGNISSMGIGFSGVLTGKGAIWGLIMPHALIKSWRGMKLLEKMSRIEHGTLCGCWTVCTNDLTGSDTRHLDELAQQFSSREEFDATLKEVLNSVPTPEELKSMITILQEGEVGIDGWDLKAEVDAGRMEMTDQIQAILDAEEEQRQAYKRQEEIINSDLSDDESLATFFKELGLDYFIIGGGFGGYGMDWGHIELADLDKIAKRDSFSKHLEDGHRLERTTNSPKSDNFGGIEPPSVTDKDGITYIFTHAKFNSEEGRFYLKTKIKKADAQVIEGAYTLFGLRKMMGEIDLQKKGFRKILAMVGIG